MFNCSNYSGQTYSVHDLHTILNDVNFDENKITVLYNYGFTQGANQPAVREVVDAYYQNGNFNFILVNYYSILINTVFVSSNNNHFRKDLNKNLLLFSECE